MKLKEEQKNIEFALKLAVGGGGQCTDTITFREMAVFSS